MKNAKETFMRAIREEMDHTYQPYADRQLIIFGTGSYAELYWEEFARMGMQNSIVAFGDNNNEMWGRKFHGLLIDSQEQLHQKYPEAVWLVASGAWDVIEQEWTVQGKMSEMCVIQPPEFLRYMEEQLNYIRMNHDSDFVAFAGAWFPLYNEMEKNGELSRMKDLLWPLLEDDLSRQILESRMEFFFTGNPDLIRHLPFSEDVYYSAEYFCVGEKEVVIDCGAYIGDSLESFLEHTGSKYGYIICLEPDTRNYLKLKEYVVSRDLDNVEVRKAATGKIHGQMCFTDDGTGGAKLSDSGQTMVDVICLDEYIDRKPSIIKMDIEGAEMDTLKGAEQILRTCKPKLAISIYHKYRDFYDIPMYLHQIVPEYHFKVRHHTHGLYDTVLYAYVDE